MPGSVQIEEVVGDYDFFRQQGQNNYGPRHASQIEQVLSPGGDFVGAFRWGDLAVDLVHYQLVFIPNIEGVDPVPDVGFTWTNITTKTFTDLVDGVAVGGHVIVDFVYTVVAPGDAVPLPPAGYENAGVCLASVKAPVVIASDADLFTMTVLKTDGLINDSHSITTPNQTGDFVLIATGYGLQNGEATQLANCTHFAGDVAGFDNADGSGFIVKNDGVGDGVHDRITEYGYCFIQVTTF